MAKDLYKNLTKKQLAAKGAKADALANFRSLDFWLYSDHRSVRQLVDAVWLVMVNEDNKNTGHKRVLTNLMAEHRRCASAPLLI